MELPNDFLAKMQRLLGDEFEAFAASFEQPGHRGLRVNTLKVSEEDFSRKRPFALESVGDFEPAGFRVVGDAPGGASPGSHPYHAAGLYYMQEPAAMTVAALMQPQPGEWILDLAAAPGGKSTHIASLLGDDGLLVANDVDRGRVRYLAENLERWGARNTLITNSAPEQLAQAWGAVFDRVLLDAPCSGEGMLRRLGQLQWSEAMVAACARRQDLILPAAAQLVRSGGVLVYSTCTFSVAENEGVIGRFLDTHPDFDLITLPHFEGFAPGIGAAFTGTVRLWPHRFQGEGHFVAAMRREGAGERGSRGERASLPPCPPAPLQLWREFAGTVLNVAWDEERLGVWNGRLFLLPESLPDTKGVRLVRLGVELGELRKGYFKPSHQLALTLRPEEAGTVIDFALDDVRVGDYLAGVDVPIRGEVKGWVLVRVDGFGIGWGKGVNGRLKNHYPRGLRHAALRR